MVIEMKVAPIIAALCHSALEPVLLLLKLQAAKLTSTLPTLLRMVVACEEKDQRSHEPYGLLCGGMNFIQSRVKLPSLSRMNGL